MADFSGWSMPIEYTDGGVLAEHTAVRTAVGLFDVSHLGTATVRGPGDVTVCRTGYTGEHGYELLVASARAGDLWDRLLQSGQASGIRPCGLGARDTLRTEMGYPLHGHELSPDITPNQARSGWAVG